MVVGEEGADGVEVGAGGADVLVGDDGAVDTLVGVSWGIRGIERWCTLGSALSITVSPFTPSINSTCSPVSEL